MFWTAPELLRDTSRETQGGTHKGDVYSFAIVLQEILYRTPPFEACNETSMVPKGKSDLKLERESVHCKLKSWRKIGNKMQGQFFLSMLI